MKKLVRLIAHQLAVRVQVGKSIALSKVIEW